MTGANGDAAPAEGLPPVLRARRLRIFGRLLANGLAQAASAVAVALLVRHGFDELLAGQRSGATPALVAVGVGLAVAWVAAGWLRFHERVDAERLGQDYVHQLRLSLFERMVASSPRSLQRRSHGGQVLRFVGDLTAMRQWVSLGLARLTVAGTLTVASLVALAVVAPSLAIVIAVVVGLGAVAALAQGPALRRSAKEARRRRGRLAANVTEKAASVAVIHAFGQRDRERRRLSRQSRKLQAAMVARAEHIGRLRGITEGTAGLAGAATLVVGAATGAEAGTVAAAMTIVGIFVPSLRDLGRVEEYRHGAAVARAKLVEVLARPTLDDGADAPEIEPGPGRLVFEGVGVGDVVRDLSVVAEPGQVVAVVGPNGAGKSTLLSLAARLIDPDEGRVLLDGQDLAEHRLDSVRRRLGLAGPDLPLLRGTVAHNLRYRWKEAPEQEHRRVAAVTGLAEVLAELPEGMETRVAEGGAGLSAGQRQRIALARALLGGPSVLLLDEADANLDGQAVSVVDDVLAAHPGTVLIVTHRRERVATADVVWHLDGGRLVECGSPAELLGGEGPTAALFGRPLRVVS